MPLATYRCDTCNLEGVAHFRGRVPPRSYQRPHPDSAQPEHFCSNTILRLGTTMLVDFDLRTPSLEEQIARRDRVALRVTFSLDNRKEPD